MSGFRILVADDHDIVRRGICSLLSSRAGWEVCAEAAEGREAVEKAKELRPDLVILDLHMPNLNGMESARQILRHNPRQRILILTITDSEHLAQQMLLIGVKGYVLKSDAATDLISAVEALQQNRTFFNSGVEQMVLQGYLNNETPSCANHCGTSTLTGREREVLQLLAEGKTTKQVASILDLSTKTAETHRSNIMHKLHCHSVTELVVYAIRHDIVYVPKLYVMPVETLLAAAGD